MVGSEEKTPDAEATAKPAEAATASAAAAPESAKTEPAKSDVFKPRPLPVVAEASDDSDEDEEDDEDEDDDEGSEEDELAQELEETIELATTRIEKEPDDVAALLIRGEALDDLGEAERAREDLERAVQLASGSAAAQLAWARFLFGEDEDDDALDAVELAIEYGEKPANSKTPLPPHPVDRETGYSDQARARARYLKAAILARREALEDALLELDRSIKLDGDEPRALLLRGEVRHATGDLDGALDDLAQAVGGDPEDPDARLARAEALLDAGEIAAAYEEVSAALELAGPDPSPEMLVVRGEVRLAEGDPVAAKEDFARAADLAPDAVEPRLGLVDVALATKDFDTAESAARDAVRLDPEHPQALVFKARVDLARGRAAEAEKSCSKAIEFDAQAADAFALRAQARKILGKLGQARHDAATAKALGFQDEIET